MDEDPANSGELCYEALFVVCPRYSWRWMKARSEREILRENRGGSSAEGKSKHSEDGKENKGPTNGALKGDPSLCRRMKGRGNWGRETEG